VKRPKPLPATFLALAVLSLVLAWHPWVKPLSPAPPVEAPAPVVPSGPGSPPSDDLPPLLWIRRIGEEVLVFSVSGDGMRPSSGAAIEFLDEAGKRVGSGRADSSGVFRGRIPGGATSVHLRVGDGATTARAVPRAPPGPANVVADRSDLSPGDLLRVCCRVLFGAEAGPVLRLEPGDPAIPPPSFVPAGLEVSLASPPRWTVFETRIPDDARPGAVVLDYSGETLRIPLTGRHAAKEPGETGPATPPRASTGIAIERRDGRWHVTGPADSTSVLTYAESGGRLLVHHGSLAMDGSSSASLGPEEAAPGSVRVTAVLAGPGGFAEASAGGAASSAVPSDPDPVLAAFLAGKPKPEAETPGPAWIHEGDSMAGDGPTPPVRPGFFEREMMDSTPPGHLVGVPVPGPQEVRWGTRPASAAGSLRIRVDGAILVETRVGPGRAEGAFRIPDPGWHMARVESDASGLQAVTFRWTEQGRPGRDPPRIESDTAVDRTLTTFGRRGREYVYTTVIHSAEGRSAAVITCPIPRGAVPAEDGWSIRERAPAGTRVELPDGAVVYRVPALGKGETVLSFRIRLAWPGTYAAAPATCGAAFSSSGFLVIE
jgi:hypothetical protein